MTTEREQEIREHVARIEASRVGIGRNGSMLSDLLDELDATRDQLRRCRPGGTLNEVQGINPDWVEPK